MTTSTPPQPDTADQPKNSTTSVDANAAQLFAGFAHRGARLIDDADPEPEAVIDTVKGRQCAVPNLPAQNSSFLRGGSYSAVITRTGGGCIPPSRTQPAPAQTARQGF